MFLLWLFIFSDSKINIFRAKCGSRHAAHTAKALRWRVKQLLKYLMKKSNLSLYYIKYLDPPLQSHWEQDRGLRVMSLLEREPECLCDELSDALFLELLVQLLSVFFSLYLWSLLEYDSSHCFCSVRFETAILYVLEEKVPRKIINIIYFCKI